MSHAFEGASFDAIVSIAAVHHMPEGCALDRMATVLWPGATLCVIGIARSRTPVDVLWEIAGAVATRVLRRRHGGYLAVVAPTTWLWFFHLGTGIWLIHLTFAAVLNIASGMDLAL
jgi:hypothetical protein